MPRMSGTISVLEIPRTCCPCTFPKSNIMEAEKTNTSANKSLRVGMTCEFRAALLGEERG